MEQPGQRTTAHGRSVAFDAAASVAARVVAMAASSITAIIVVASLDKHQYGAYALAAGLAGVLAVALDAGSTSSVARFLAQGRGSAVLVGRVVVIRLAALLCGGALVGTLGWAGVIGGGFGELLGPAAVLLVALGSVSFLYGALPSMRRIRLLLLVTVLQPLLELGAVLVIRSRGGDATEMLLAAAGAAAVSALLAYALLAVRPSRIAPPVATSEPAATVGDVLHYGRRLFFVLLLMMVFGQLDQFVIQAFHGEADVAPYALSIKLQALLIAPAVTATAIIAPRIAGSGASGAAMYRQWMAFFVVLYAGAAVVFAVLATELFTAINPEYAGDDGVLLALLPFMFLSAIATLPSVTLNQTGHAASRLRLAAIALAINVVLDLLLVPVLAAYGAAIGTTAAFAYYAWAHHRLLDRALRATAVTPPPPMRGMLVRGGAVALAMGALAFALRPLAQQLASGTRAEAIAVVLVGVGVPALIHVAVTTRLVRRA